MFEGEEWNDIKMISRWVLRAMIMLAMIGLIRFAIGG